MSAAIAATSMSAPSVLLNWPSFDLFSEPMWMMQPLPPSPFTRQQNQPQLAALGAADVIEVESEYHVVVDTPGFKGADVKVCPTFG